MDPESRRLLEETHALAKDNHRMLAAIRRGQWFTFFGQIIFWVIVLAVPFYLFQQYLGPLLARFEALYPSSSTATSTGIFSHLPTLSEFENLLHSPTSK